MRAPSLLEALGRSTRTQRGGSRLPWSAKWTAATGGPGYIQLLHGHVWAEPKPCFWKQGLNYARGVDQKTGSRCSGRVHQSLKHPAGAEGPEGRTIMGQECGARCRFHTFGAAVLQMEVEIGSMPRNSSLGLKDRNGTHAHRPPGHWTGGVWVGVGNS